MPLYERNSRTNVRVRKSLLVGFTLVTAASIAFGGASAAAGALLRSAVATPVAYEPFCYSAGVSPGTLGSGWLAGWTGNGALVDGTGLTYSGGGFQSTACIPSSPNSSLGPTPGSAATRTLLSPVAPPASGVILRALIRSKVAGTPGTQATLGNSTGGTLTIGDLPVGDPLGGKWGIQVNGGATHFSTVQVQADVTAALTAEVDFGANSGQDRVRLWVQTAGPYCDPAVSTCTPAFDGSAPPMSAFSGVFWQTQGQGALVDEISVEKITPAPPTGRICVLKFEDKNGNGVQDPGEGALANWVFTVSTSPASTLTTTGGEPVCMIVPAGTYTVTETPQTG
jgi:hypothetical protein